MTSNLQSVIAMEIEERNLRKQSLLICLLLSGNIYKFRDLQQSVISKEWATEESVTSQFVCLRIVFNANKISEEEYLKVIQEQKTKITKNTKDKLNNLIQDLERNTKD